MGSTQFKAILITFLFFGGLVFYFVGIPELPDFSALLNGFKSEEKEVPIRKRKKDSKVGQVIDQYRGVDIYYNGLASNVQGRNKTKDGYNLGLRFQCVEFAKRFYYEAFGHKMPDSYGHAKDFYDTRLKDGAWNKARGMYQFQNGSRTKPQRDDLVVLGATSFNSFGHLVVITGVSSGAVEFVQQNPGPRNPSRGRYKLINQDGLWTIDESTIRGWLRLKR